MCHRIANCIHVKQNYVWLCMCLELMKWVDPLNECNISQSSECFRISVTGEYIKR